MAMTGFATAIIVTSIIVVIAGSIYLFVSDKIRSFSSMAFGTPDIVDGYKKTKRELSETPKSICAMTKVYLPLIAKDFPGFNYRQFCTMAETMLLSAFTAVTKGEADLLKNASEELHDEVALHIENNKLFERREVYSDITVHGTEIANYEKRGGVCVITLQSAVGHIHYIEQKGGKLYEGERDLKEQVRYNTELVYIQDPTKLSGGINTGHSLTCPNCGAPVRELGGEKKCEYCGSVVQEIDAYVWSINKFTKL